MKHIFKNRQSGFSLVELMIVVGIIGVLATLALPRFKQFQAKAKMSEAANTLSHMYTLEQSYSLDNNTFVAVPAYGANVTAGVGCTASANPIGFSIDPCNSTSPTPRFSYTATSASADVFVATAATGGATGTQNRVCAGNAAFSILRNQLNEPTWRVGTGTATAGAPNIGTVCAQ